MSSHKVDYNFAGLRKCILESKSMKRASYLKKLIMHSFQFCVQTEVTRVSACRCLSSRRPASFQLLTFTKIQTRVFASLTISCQTLHSFPGMPINLINVLSFVPLALSKQLNSIFLTSLSVALTPAREKCVLVAAMKRLPARLKLALRRQGTLHSG